MKLIIEIAQDNLMLDRTFEVDIINRIGLDGKSAYQIAIDDGLFEGTEQEYGNYPIVQGNFAREATTTALTAAQTASDTALGINDAINNANRATSEAIAASQRVQLSIENAAQKANEAQSAANLANEKAVLAANKALMAENAAGSASEGAQYATLKGGYAAEQGHYANAQGDHAKNQGDYARQTADNIKTSLLAVTLTQTSVTNLAYAFTKANFDTVAAAVNAGLPVSVKLTDNRAPVLKTIDLSGVYPAKWNTTLSQIEVSDPNVARGFYMNGTTPTSRGCVSADTAKYVQRGAAFNATTGFYELNTVVDLSEADMSLIYSQTAFVPTLSSYASLFYVSKLKTNYVPLTGGFTPWEAAGHQPVNCRAMFRGTTSLKVINVGDRLKVGDPLYFCLGCSRLEKIIGIIDMSENTILTVLWFMAAVNLEFVQIFGLKLSASFSDSPLLSKESLVYLLTNRANAVGVSITITVHSTVYAWASADAQVQALLTATATQGQVILASA